MNLSNSEQHGNQVRGEMLAHPATTGHVDARMRALRACALAAAAFADRSLTPSRRAEILMEAHGMLMAAHGPGRFPSFGEFRRGLYGPIEDMLPRSAVGLRLQVTLLSDDGELHPMTRDLLLEASTRVDTEAQGLAHEMAQLSAVFHAAARVGVASGPQRVLAEVVQRTVFEALRKGGRDSYRTGRERLIRDPAMPLTRLRRDDGLASLDIYGPIPRSRHANGWWAPCPGCKWPMTVEFVRGTNVYSCPEHRRDLGAEYAFGVEGSRRTLHPTRDALETPELQAIDDWRTVPYPVWRYVTIPGLLELALKDDLDKLGADVELWPFTDLYDLDVRVGARLHRRVDVKAWSSPHDLVTALANEEIQAADTIVVPDHQEPYVSFLQEGLRTANLTVWTASMLRMKVEAALKGRRG